MFLSIFGALCERKGVSRSAAARACGLSNSTTTKWKKTQAIPESATLVKLAEYFGVSVDYLLGATPESYMVGTEYKLKETEREFRRETDPEKKEELAALMDLLNDSLTDQRAVSSSTQTKRETPKAGTDDMEDVLQTLRERPDMRMLFNVTKKSSPESVMKLAEFLKGLEPDDETD